MRFFKYEIFLLALLQGPWLRAACTASLLGYNSEIPRFGGLSENKTPLQTMANILLEEISYSAPGQLQVAFPALIEVNPNQSQQFGDGQQNANSHLAGLKNPPFVARLSRAYEKSGKVFIEVSKELSSLVGVTEIEVSVLGEELSVRSEKAGEFSFDISTEKMGWNGLYDAKALFFRPKGWKDWFVLSFPQAYLPIEKLLAGMREEDRRLPTGESVVNPLALHSQVDPQNQLRLIKPETNLGFEMARVSRSARVHGHYLSPDGKTVLTSTGGVWTRFYLGAPFKNVYLAKDGRVLDLEEDEGVVSGTGPHKIGATAEIILNSVGSKPLMTFYGLELPKVGPRGEKIAWGSELTHLWIGTWLKPGEAFVTPQGNFHWHLNHLTQTVAAQVWTPPEAPSPENFFGFKRP
jgi:hypothetical protein